MNDNTTHITNEDDEDRELLKVITVIGKFYGDGIPASDDILEVIVRKIRERGFRVDDAGNLTLPDIDEQFRVCGCLFRIIHETMNEFHV